MSWPASLLRTGYYELRKATQKVVLGERSEEYYYCYYYRAHDVRVWELRVDGPAVLAPISWRCLASTSTANAVCSISFMCYITNCCEEAESSHSNRFLWDSLTASACFWWAIYRLCTGKDVITNENLFVTVFTTAMVCMGLGTGLVRSFIILFTIYPIYLLLFLLLLLFLFFIFSTHSPHLRSLICFSWE